MDSGQAARGGDDQGSGNHAPGVSADFRTQGVQFG